jgi:hypothetical protein
MVLKGFWFFFFFFFFFGLCLEMKINKCLSIWQLLGSHLVAHLGLHQSLDRPTMQVTILLLQSPLVVLPLLVHKLGVLYSGVLQLECLVQPHLLHLSLPPRPSVLHRHRLLEAQCLLLEHLLLHLVVHHHHLVVCVTLFLTCPICFILLLLLPNDLILM